MCHLTPNWKLSFLNLHLVLRKKSKTKNPTVQHNNNYYSILFVCWIITHGFVGDPTLNPTLLLGILCLKFGCFLSYSKN